MNQYETQGIRENFLKEGYCEVEEKADVYVINSCTVTAEADRDARAAVRACRKENPKAKIVVTGCYAQKDEKEILALGGVAHVIKQHDKTRIREILDGLATTSFEKPRYLSLAISDFKGHTRAFVKVQDGCDYRCAFCKVWGVRGKSVSRPLPEIVREAERLAERGFREIVLTGVSLGLYGRDFEEPLDILDVVGTLESVEGLERIRLSSIDPVDVKAPFIEKLFLTRKCCRQLHLSLQSGDDAVLSRMQRNYSSAHYRAIVQNLREKDPGFSVTTDVIVGFPGETEEAFENTLRFVAEVNFTRVHLFPYSHRKGTVAYRFQEQVPPQAIRSRMKRIEGIAREASFRYRKPLLGKEVGVLSESPEADGFLSGYTEQYVRVFFRGDKSQMGKILPVRIEEVTPHRTMGSVIT